MAKVTVITPCYNSAAFIRETVRSVLDQDLQEWEYILIDDGSTDGTYDCLTRFACADKRIKVLHQANKGTSYARNLGAKTASEDSTYLIFLDHDDLLERGALRTLSEYLNTHAEVCLVGCQFQEIDAGGNFLPSKGRSRWVPSIFGIPRPLRPSERKTPFVAFYCATGQGPFAMFRRSVFEQTTGWTTQFWPHEDTDIFCQMALLGEVHYLPDRLYRKRTHSASGMRNSERLMRSYGAFRAKWDKYQPRNPREAKLLDDAAQFYRASFRPLRGIKVGTKAMREFISGGGVAKLSWALRLYRDAIRDLIRYRLPSFETKTSSVAR
jgi:glycosyltransferase involved in cell wall biosynthesis